MTKWTSDQELAITSSGTNIIVSAGAGSGKTAVLTERVIRKLINGTNINRLLILTFTKLAAAEMKERIRKAIKKVNLNDQLDYLDSAYITTFDSFCLSIVKKYHTYLNINSNISIMDASIEEYKVNQIIDDIFEESYNDSNFQKLVDDFCNKSDANLKVIIKDMSKNLDLLARKKEHLQDYIDKFFSAEFIDFEIDNYLNLVLKTKDSISNPYKELKTRVDYKYLNDFNIEPLLESETYEDIKNNILLIGTARKNKNCDPEFKKYKDEIDIIIKKLKDLTRFIDIRDMKESYLSTKPYVEAIIKIINKLDDKFLEYKKECNLYTYTDVALMTLNVILENPKIKDELKSNFDEIMVDEYQDTSNIQETLINLISNNNLYMVGDIKQSIYRFRNANPYIFKTKYDDYSKSDGGKKIDLLKNFRSRSEVVDNINLIFNLIMDEEVGDANYKESHQMIFGNTNYLENRNENQDYNMEIMTYDKKQIKDYSSDEVEAFYIVSDIKNKIDNKYQVLDKETGILRNCTYKDFSIIMDRNTTFDLYKKIFEYMGIPIQLIKTEKLTIGDDLVILKNLINLIIKINLNELDDEFKYYFTSISRSYLSKISDEEIFDIIKQNKFKEAELYKICESININELSNLDLINVIIDKFNLYEKLITIGNIKESMIRIGYLKDLSINLSNIGYTPLEFSKYLNEMVEKDTIEYSINTDDSDSVKILNIHKSKGLEYNICYFSGLYKKSNDEDKKAKFTVADFKIITPYVNDGIKETILKDLLIDSYEQENISEKIRLFYVALTRTREKFIIVCPLEEKDNFNTLVPTSIRLKYNKISDMLESIYNVLTPYIKNIDIKNINLTKDYEKIKIYNYKKKLNVTNEKINKIKNNIVYEKIKESRYSKDTNKLITKEEYDNMKRGTKLHYIFEVEDFKKSDNPYILKFIKHIDINYINCFKEYEFIYEEESEIKHGFIDLMLEYSDHIDIIDYKMKNITDENYLKQLQGYKKYIESISAKKVYIYLYSIIDDNLKKLS